MRRMLRWEMPESGVQHQQTWNPKRINPAEGLGLVTRRVARGSATGVNHCAKCGSEVKVFVSPKRNPHSSKLGRAVSMKDHDLCRRCWRQLMHQQRKAEVVALPLALFVRKETLQPRLLIPLSYSVPREVS